jgi:AcrR family transcriptional regulator
MPRPKTTVPDRARGSRSAKATQRGPQKRGERTRRRILEAAEALFAQSGYSDTSLDAIAENAGMHQPGIFYYYPDKWALYEAVVEDAMGELDRITTASLASAGSPEQRLLAMASNWVDLLRIRPGLANLLLRESANPDPSTMPRLIPDAGQRIQSLIQDLLREIHPDVHADDVFHLQSATSWLVPLSEDRAHRGRLGDLVLRQLP